ncbi:uncharacterized protein LOC132555386 [Ylistrum balloti]|uniref:uncharacterized protein LOC132555386 n=1 Tax=Ylistrum balloti TaxID=509963 RepID=UPI002905C441|nr:uncharacterized protein LOC132555386 [Ylistrum balloti]
MKGGTISLLMLVMVCTLVLGKKVKHRQTREAEETKMLQINQDLVRTKRKTDGPTLSRMKRIHDPETELKRMKRTRRSLTLAKQPHNAERALKRMKRVPKEAILHRAKRVRAEKTLRRIKRLRRDLRTELKRHRRNTDPAAHRFRVPIMKRGHRMSRPHTDKRSQARLDRMKAAIGRHIQQRKRNRFMHHKMKGPLHKKNDVMSKNNGLSHKRIAMKKNNVHHSANKSNNNDKKHHVQAHN